ncbi:hypothetical protein PPYR_14248 [Photinus pyralis]|uniref:Pyrroline-5-carboxylate reductase n=1 Tax=Photinus pyralis TaxID=7054 RepID=A0A1Y1KTM8_PHOPY|nr:pyrroline-5-carboxylate reductase [Photinus pyralis]KAB0792289.1 hypothetical protein PPYR_14248 [Photinus pyralis]
MSANILKIGFIGGGKMAKALAGGFISAGLTKAENVMASFHPSDTQCARKFEEELGGRTVFENKPVVELSDLVLMAVKPTVMPTVLNDIKTAVTNDKLLISIAMGVTLGDIMKHLPYEAKVIRVMPNTPALSKCGTSVLVRGENATDNDVLLTKRLFSAIGICEEVPEHLFDAITAVSGSGPAYVYVFIEALADGAVKMGIPRELAYRLSAQTVLGAAQMVKDTKMHPGALKDDVTSPAGCTAAALHYLEKKCFRSAIIGAVEEATRRCLQVSKTRTK